MFFRYVSRDAKRHANKPFRMNTYESVSKQRTLTTFRINTYEKTGGRGATCNLTKHSRFRHHMRHVAPLSPLASLDCAYFLSPRVYPMRAGNEVQLFTGRRSIFFTL
jgi:hypothetical protein